jgi:DNA-3-methyladenine glycosylase
MLDVDNILQSSCSDNRKPVYGLSRLKDSFYNVPCEYLAKGLLGKVLVRRLNDGTLIKGRIVETECYLGGEDKASHSYNGKITERSKPMYMKPGTTYVYITYGMYHCFNISSQGLCNSLSTCT